MTNIVGIMIILSTMIATTGEKILETIKRNILTTTSMKVASIVEATVSRTSDKNITVSTATVFLETVSTTTNIVTTETEVMNKRKIGAVMATERKTKFVTPIVSVIIPRSEVENMTEAKSAIWSGMRLECRSVMTRVRNIAVLSTSGPTRQRNAALISALKVSAVPRLWFAAPRLCARTRCAKSMRTAAAQIHQVSVVLP